MFGTNENEIMSNPTFWTKTNASPTRQWYWRLLAQNVDGTVTSFGLALEVKIEYDVVFKNWKDEGVSSFNPKPSVRKSTAYRDWETDRKSTRLNSSHRL